MRSGLVAIAVLVWLASCDCPPLALVVGAPPPADAGADADGGPGDGAVDAPSPAPALDWAIPVGRQSSPAIAGATSLAAVVPLGDGGVIVAGRFTGTVSFAPDKTLVAGQAGSGFAARYRRDQQLVWVRLLAAPVVAVADMAALGGDEVAVVGWFAGTLTIPESGTALDLASHGRQDAFIVRLAADGSVRFMTGAGGDGDDIARAVAAHVDPSGAATIAIRARSGTARFFSPGAGAAPAPSGSGPIYAAELDSDGNFDWVSFAGGGIPGQGYGVAIDDAGAAVVTGYVNGAAPFGRGPGGVPVTVDPANGRAFVARWGAGGDLEWARSLAGPDGEGDAIAIGAAGEIVSCGLFEGVAQFGAGASAPSLTADIPGRPGVYLAALGAGGDTLWARRLTGVGMRPWRLHRASGGHLLVAASFGAGIVVDPEGPHPLTLFSSGATDAAFIHLGADGALTWAISGGGPGDDEGVDFAEAADRTSWAVGDYAGPASFGLGAAAVTLTSGTDGNAFLLHLER